jgi:hypothetical protein
MFISERYNMGHNDWSKVFRTVFAVLYGRDTKIWPKIADTIIYHLSSIISNYWKRRVR